MVIRFNFFRIFFYCLLATLLSVSGMGFFDKPLEFCLVFAIIYFIEGEAREDAFPWPTDEEEE